MATSVPVEPSEKECPVCHEQFTEPKLLPCGHELCKLCLVSWLQSNAEAHCPLCRCAILKPEERSSGKSFEDVAESFPTDLAMAALVETQQLMSKDHVCQACVTQTATSLCLTCNDLFCASCATVHKRLTATRHHTLEELSTLSAEKLAASRPSFCSVHTDKTSEVYCPTHGASICLLCATTDHRQCPEVTMLETKIEESRAKLAELVASLSAGETELEQLDQHLQDTEKRMQAAIVEIEAMCDRLESAVKARRRRLKELAVNACSEAKEAVNEGKAVLLQRKGKMTTHKGVLQRAEEMTTLDIVNGMTSPMQTRVKDLDCSTLLPADARTISTVTLVIDPEAVSRMERELQEIGQLKVVPAYVLAQKKVVPADVLAQKKVAPADVLAQKLPVLRFHSNHGACIKLSNNQQTAVRTSSNSNGVVVSRDPMRINMLYEVVIDQTNNSRIYYNFVGVVTESPDTIILPSLSWQLRSAVVVCDDWIMVNGTRTDTRVGAPLCDVTAGSSVGLALDKRRNLHLYVDDKHLGVVAPGVADPSYFMVDLRNFWSKVTARPVKRVMFD